MGLTNRLQRGTNTVTRFLEMFTLRLPRRIFVGPFTKTRSGRLRVSNRRIVRSMFRRVRTLIKNRTNSRTGRQRVNTLERTRPLLRDPLINDLTLLRHIRNGVISGIKINLKIVSVRVSTIRGTTRLPTSDLRSKVRPPEGPKVRSLLNVNKTSNNSTIDNLSTHLRVISTAVVFRRLTNAFQRARRIHRRLRTMTTLVLSIISNRRHLSTLMTLTVNVR